MKGYLTVVEAKLLQPLSETFCLFPTNGVNCRYLDRLTSRASMVQRKPAKNGNPTAAGRFSDD